MCYYYRPLTAKGQVDNDFVNGFSHPKMPIIVDQNPNDIILGKWGLVPSWAKDDKEFLKKSNTLNAMIETAEEKPSYRNYVNNRCLVMAESFKEWKHETIEGKLVKTPYEISMPDGKPFAMAGLYSIWNNQITYTILTTAANELMVEIHNTKKRMPVILIPEERKLWLNKEPLEPYWNRMEVELKAIPLI